MERASRRITILGWDTDDEDITYDLTGRFGQPIHQIMEEQDAQRAAACDAPRNSSLMDVEKSVGSEAKIPHAVVSPGKRKRVRRKDCEAFGPSPGKQEKVDGRDHDHEVKQVAVLRELKHL